MYMNSLFYMYLLTGKHISPVKSGEVHGRTIKQPTKLWGTILGTILYFGTCLMITRLYHKKEEKIFDEKCDAIIESEFKNHLLSAEQKRGTLK